MRPLLLLGLLALALLAYNIAQATEDVKVIFTRYCGSCHNGVRAPTFEATVAKIRTWALTYATLDDAVRSEYKYMGGASSYKEMMEAKRRMVPWIPEEDYKKLYEYFANVFAEAKKQLKNMTTVVIATVTQQPPRGYGEALARASLAASSTVFIVAVAVAYLAYRAREQHPQQTLPRLS